MQQPETFRLPEPLPYEFDPGDVIVPDSGYVFDYVAAYRGNEIPTSFAVWTALYTVSTMLDRRAWLKWGRDKLWPNIYVVLVAVPALCRKTHIIEGSRKLLKGMSELAMSMGEIELVDRKYQFITNKNTSEAIWDALVPGKSDSHTIEHGKHKGQTAFWEYDSHISICVDELGTFLSKKKYNTGLIDTLTDLYDCKDDDSQRTLGRGEQTLKNIYVTMIGGITPDGMRTSLPSEAFGEGFMSRVNIVFEEAGNRILPKPRILEGFPTLDTLRERLLYLASKSDGEYDMTPEAEAYYNKWYMEWKKDLLANTSNVKQADYRRDVNMLRIALLLRVSEYEPGFDITLKNVKQAMTILEYTYDRSRATLHEASNDDPLMKGAERTIDYLKAHGSVKRTELVRTLGKKMPVSLVEKVIEHLADSGQIAGYVTGRGLVNPRERIYGMDIQLVGVR